MAENWAESATTAKPQITKTGTTMNGESPNTSGVRSATVPETAIDVPAASVRPDLSAQSPKSHAPTPPIPMMKKVAVDTKPSLCPDASADAARNAAVQAHIAYNSHMWPR